MLKKIIKIKKIIKDLNADNVEQYKVVSCAV